MARKKGGLGRGLAALIPDNQQDAEAQPSSPLDVIFGQGPDSAASPLMGGSARDLLMPGATKRRGNGGVGLSGRSQKSGAGDTKTRGERAAAAASPSTVGGASERDSGAGVGGSTATTTAPRGGASGVAGGNASSGLRTDLSALSGDQVSEAGSVAEDRASSDFAAVSADDAVGVNADAAATGGGDEDVELVALEGTTFGEIPVDAIVPNRRQPREVFDEEMLEELAESIRQVGVLQPVVVRRVKDPDVSRETGSTYEIIMGERRWRATQRAGLTTVPALIRQTDDADMLREALLENLHRSQLNPLEEAAAYQQLMEDFSCTQAELSRRIARSRPQIANTLRLLKLPAAVQRRVAAEVLSAGHARALLGLTEIDDMEYLADRIVAEGLSVRTTEEIVALGDVRGSARGGTGSPKKAPKASQPLSPRYAQLVDRLTDRLETRVKVMPGKKKGRIVIEFSDDDDLGRIEQIITAGDR